MSPAAPGREARRDNEYERRGTANVFCAVEPKDGRHFTFPTPDRSGFEFARVALELALAYPEAKTIHLVMDNLNIHRQKALTDVFGAKLRPKSGIGLQSTTHRFAIRAELDFGRAAATAQTYRPRSALRRQQIDSHVALPERRRGEYL